jgi:hypothetical protein
MSTADLILIAVEILLIALVLFIFIRNNKVAKFRRQILLEDYDESMFNLARGYLKEVDNYSKLPSYHRMVFSFKPLTKKHWL